MGYALERTAGRETAHAHLVLGKSAPRSCFRREGPVGSQCTYAAAPLPTHQPSQMSSLLIPGVRLDKRRQLDKVLPPSGMGAPVPVVPKHRLPQFDLVSLWTRDRCERPVLVQLRGKSPLPPRDPGRLDEYSDGIVRRPPGKPGADQASLVEQHRTVETTRTDDGHHLCRWKYRDVPRVSGAHLLQSSGGNTR